MNRPRRAGGGVACGTGHYNVRGVGWVNEADLHLYGLRPNAVRTRAVPIQQMPSPRELFTRYRTDGSSDDESEASGSHD